MWEVRITQQDRWPWSQEGLRRVSFTCVTHDSKSGFHDHPFVLSKDMPHVLTPQPTSEALHCFLSAILRTKPPTREPLGDILTPSLNPVPLVHGTNSRRWRRIPSPFFLPIFWQLTLSLDEWYPQVSETRRSHFSSQNVFDQENPQERRERWRVCASCRWNPSSGSQDGHQRQRTAGEVSMGEKRKQKKSQLKKKKVTFYDSEAQGGSWQGHKNEKTFTEAT